MADSDHSIYDERGIPTVINGVGTRTQVSGSRLRPEAREAMHRASEEYVYMTDLQAHASDRIAAVTGSEAGIVTAGTAAALTLATAASIAGDDYDTMTALPHHDGPTDVVIPRAHRCKYSPAFRAGGASLVEVGPVSHHPVNGGVDAVDPWRIASAIGPETVAVAYLSRPYNRLSLETVVDVAHDHDVPVIVDAADDTFPPARMRRLLATGADLVAFSGGKRIRGPQSTGILAGRTDLIRSAAVQMLSDGYDPSVWSPPSSFIDPEAYPGVPPTGIGRGMKVAKEDILGLLAALDAYLEEDHVAVHRSNERIAERIAERLQRDQGNDSRIASVRIETNDPPESATDSDIGGMPAVVVRFDNPSDTATDVVRELRTQSPRVWVGESHLHLNEVTISPQCLDEEEADILVDRLITASSVSG